MKQTLTIIFSLLFLNTSFGQKIDTLKVIVLSPNKIEVSKEFQTEYIKLKEEILAKRKVIKEEKTEEKQTNIAEFNQQPDYTKIMFDNELSFYDSLTIDNYISLVVREYIAYRLFKPYKIKPRLVLVSTQVANSDTVEYLKIAKGQKNLFIINFPKVEFYKDKRQLKVRTKIELYSSKTNEILLSKENIGTPEGGMTDYPMCSGDNWDCAMVNSAYPSLFDIVKTIAEKNADGK